MERRLEMKPDREGTTPDDAGEGKTRKSLRRRAEERMSIKGGTEETPDQSEDLQKIIHELRVHQIELEIQNEELLRIRNELDAEVERYSELYDFAPVGIFTLDKNSTIIEVNLNGAVMLGTNRSSLCGRRFLDFIAEEFRADFNDFMKGVFEDTEKDTHEIECSLKVDSGIFAHISAHVREAGEFCLIAVMDITGLKESEAALAASEEKFHIMFEKSPIPYQSLDADGRFMEVNEAWLDSLGYARKDVIGRWFGDFLAPEQVELFRKRFPVFKKIGEIYDAEFLMKRKDGRMLLTSFDGKIGYFPDGSFRQTHCVWRDITAQREAEEALQESEEKYRSLVENISDVIFIMDLTGKITYISPVVKEIYGFSPDEIIGHQFTRFIYPGDLEQVIEGFKKRVAGEFGENEFRLPAKNGDEHYVKTSQTPIIAKGRITGFNYIMTDITDRKMAEDALHMANKKLNTLSSITRHDILNMIMVIRGYLDLSEGLERDPVLKDYIVKEKEALSTIQHQIEFTRQYQDVGVNAPVWANPSEIVEEVLKRLDMTGIDVECNLEGLEIFADPLIGNVFYNLMENSIRHGEHVTVISLSSSRTNGGLVITYCDNGVGLSEEDREKLFRKGFGKNTGLGLFLSREILSITGINIEENRKKGKGVNFEIAIPEGNFRYANHEES